jgi:hypothetical protein
MPTRLNAYKIDAAEAAQKVKGRFLERDWKLGEHGDIDADAAAAIVERSLSAVDQPKFSTSAT